MESWHSASETVRGITLALIPTTVLLAGVILARFVKYRQALNSDSSTALSAGEPDIQLEQVPDREGTFFSDN